MEVESYATVLIVLRSAVVVAAHMAGTRVEESWAGRRPLSDRLVREACSVAHGFAKAAQRCAAAMAGRRSVAQTSLSLRQGQGRLRVLGWDCKPMRAGVVQVM